MGRSRKEGWMPKYEVPVDLKFLPRPPGVPGCDYRYGEPKVAAVKKPGSAERCHSHKMMNNTKAGGKKRGRKGSRRVRRGT